MSDIKKIPPVTWKNGGPPKDWADWDIYLNGHFIHHDFVREVNVLSCVGILYRTDSGLVLKDKETGNPIWYKCHGYFEIREKTTWSYV